MIKLSQLRRLLALFFLLTGTLFIVQLPFLSLGFFEFFPKIQLVPALLSGSVITVTFIVILTVIFGRIYCSVLCPLGIFQDLIIHLKNRLSSKNVSILRERMKQPYEAPKSILRYSILFLTLLGLLFGSTFLLVFLDPYSIYTRFSVHILHPVGVALNNGLASIFEPFGNYTFAIENYLFPPVLVGGITLVLLGLIVWLTIKRDRFWCNAVCPVGTALGLLSIRPLVGVGVDQSLCQSCRKCAVACKSKAINHEDCYRIDYSRCVACYNCIDSCDTRHGIQLRLMVHPTNCNRKEGTKK